MQEHRIHWQTVFFDFDGVIADSNRVKTDAFSSMFRKYGKEVETAVIEHHRNNGGMPRQAKIAYYCKEFLEMKPDQVTIDTLAKEFSDKVIDRVVAAPLITGALKSLEALRSASIPAFVISGTPHEEMKFIVTRKGLAKYFCEVHGSPSPKTDIARDILQRFSLTPSSCLFVGDALADHQAAVNTGMHFLGITSADSPVVFPDDVVISSKVLLPQWPHKP